MKARVIVDCEEPSVRAAMAGLITHLLRMSELKTEVIPMAHQTDLVNQAVNDAAGVAAMMSMMKDFEVTVVEQLELTDDMVANSTSIDGGGSGVVVKPHLKTSVSKIMSSVGGHLKEEFDIGELGIKREEVAEIMQGVHEELGTAEGEPMDQAMADKAVQMMSERLAKYVEGKMPDCPVTFSADARRTPTGFDFSIAMAIDKDKLREFIRNKKRRE